MASKLKKKSFLPSPFLNSILSIKRNKKITSPNAVVCLIVVKKTSDTLDWKNNGIPSIPIKEVITQNNKMIKIIGKKSCTVLTNERKSQTER